LCGGWYKSSFTTLLRSCFVGPMGHALYVVVKKSCTHGLSVTVVWHYLLPMMYSFHKTAAAIFPKLAKLHMHYPLTQINSTKRKSSAIFFVSGL